MSVKVTRNVGRPTKVEEGLVDWGVRVAEEMQDQQIAKDFVASGRSLKQYEVVIAKPNVVDILWASYLQFSLEGVGRQPGSYPPINAIVQWLIDKKIKPSKKQTLNSLAFVIARKMAEEGNMVFRGKRSGIDLDDILENSWYDIKDEMALEVAQEAATHMAVNEKKLTKAKK